MYSNNAPPSFVPGEMSGFDQYNEFQSNATGVDYSQPPSQGDMAYGQWNSYNQFQEVRTSRELDQTTVIDDDNKAPSLPDMCHGQRNSYNQNPDISRGFVGDSNVSGTGGRPFSRGDLVKVHISDTSGGGGGSYPEGKPPSFGDMGQKGASESGASPVDGFDDLDATDFEGMSMVARTFKKFHPKAYYMKEDDEYYVKMATPK